MQKKRTPAYDVVVVGGGAGGTMAVRSHRQVGWANETWVKTNLP